MEMKELLSGESKNIEYKQEIPTKSDRYMKTVIAFANSDGGKIIFGIEDGTHRVIGFPKEEIPQKLDMISNAIWDSCQPRVPAEVYPMEIEGKTVIIAEISRGASRPYCLRGSGLWDGTYIRFSGTSRQAPEYMVREMSLESTNQSYDRQGTDRFLSKEEIDRLCERLYQHALENSLFPEEQEKIKRIGRDQLISWGLIIEKKEGDQATHGYQLLDGAGFYEDAVIQCARFRGDTRAIFIDKKEYNGPIDEQVESALRFVLNYLSLGSRIVGAKRQDYYELPYNSVREMIANAVCHRSYLAPEKIQVALYDNRLEVTSPGMLGEGLTIEKMKNGRSMIRNKGIAAVFSYIHLIEGWGSGIPKIIKDARGYGLREPELIDMDGAFRINLYRKNFQFDSFGVINPHTAIREEEGEWIPNPENRSAAGRKKASVSEQILDLLREDPGLTQEELSEQIGLSLRTVKRAMRTMQDQGILARDGNKRSGIWVINPAARFL